MENFWNNLPKPFYILAPMEAVTDVVFRHVIAAAAPPDIYFTEFTNAASYCSPAGEHSTRGRLAFTPDEQPIVAQIWGSKPEHFEQMSIGLAKKGFAGIDINMGCPDKAVIKSQGGSDLIRNPELASELIAAAKAGGLPVSVKTRLGYSHVDERRDWLAHLFRQDIVNLTIHLRTKKEMSKVPAHFELIPEIKKLRDEIAPQTLLTINGDIRDHEHGEELVRKYGVDGIMIGRGVFTNPFAFAKNEDRIREAEDRIWNVEDGGKRVATSVVRPLATSFSESSAFPAERGKANNQLAPSALEEKDGGEKAVRLINLLHLHLDLFDKYSAELEPRRYDPLKRFFKIYIRDFDGAAEARDKLMQTKNTAEARAVLSEISKN